MSDMDRKCNSNISSKAFSTSALLCGKIHSQGAHYTLHNANFKIHTAQYTLQNRLSKCAGRQEQRS